MTGTVRSIARAVAVAALIIVSTVSINSYANASVDEYGVKRCPGAGNYVGVYLSSTPLNTEINFVNLLNDNDEQTEVVQVAGGATTVWSSYTQATWHVLLFPGYIDDVHAVCYLGG